MKLLEENNSNVFSSRSISKLLLDINNNEYEKIENIIDNEDDSNEESEHDMEDDNIKDINDNFGSMSLDNHDFDYYLREVIKDLDIDNIKKLVKEELDIK